MIVLYSRRNRIKPDSSDVAAVVRAVAQINLINMMESVRYECEGNASLI